MKNNSNSLTPEQCAGGPVAIVKGKPFEATFGCNDTGAAKNDESLEFIKQNVLPALNPPPSAELGALGICDCYADHYSAAMVTFCAENNISLQLRIPNSSSTTQNEDLVNFGSFKPLFSNAKQRAYRDIIRSSHGAKTSLDSSQLVSLTKEPWERAFDMNHNIEAWAAAGLRPFNRKPYWTVRHEEEKAVAQLSRSDRISITEAQLRLDSLLWEPNSSHNNNNVPHVTAPGEDSSDSGDDEEEEGEQDEAVAGPAMPPTVKLTKVKPGELALSGPVTHSAMVARLNAFKQQQVDLAAARQQRKETAAAKKLSREAEKARQAQLTEELKGLQVITPGLVAQVKQLHKDVKYAQQHAQSVTEIEADLAHIEGLLTQNKQRIEEVKLAKKNPPGQAPHV